MVNAFRWFLRPIYLHDFLYGRPHREPCYGMVPSVSLSVRPVRADKSPERNRVDTANLDKIF